MDFKSEIKFIDGNLIYKKSYFVLFPISPWCLLQNKILKNKKIEKLIKKELIKFVFEIIYNLKGKNNLNLKSFIDFLNELGFGLISAINLQNNNEILIKCEKSKLNKVNYKFFKSNNLNSHNILKIIIEIFLKIIYKRKIESKISLKKFNIYLKFKITDEKSFLKFENKNQKNKFYLFKLNSLIKRVLIGNKFQHKFGNISLLGVNMVLLPKIIFTLKFENKKINNEIFDIGLAQGNSAHKLLKKLYGSSKIEKIIKCLTFQSNLLGFGIIKILKNDILNQKLKLEFSEDFFVKKELNFIGTYSIGITIGALESIYLKKFFYKNNNKSINIIEFYSNNQKIKYNVKLTELILKLNLNSKLK